MEGNRMNQKSIEELYSEKEEAQKKMLQWQNREKILLNRQRNEERRARNHRLIEHGAILESIFPDVVSMSGEEVKALLLNFRRLPVKQSSRKMEQKNETGS